MLRNEHGGPLIGLRLFTVALRYLLPFQRAGACCSLTSQKFLSGWISAAS
jgi:hypothetical protein